MIQTRDLLYAHGLMCSWAFRRSMNEQDAQRLCEVINNFQSDLRESLVPNAKNFEVVPIIPSVYYQVQPIGGWTHS